MVNDKVNDVVNVMVNHLVKGVSCFMYELRLFDVNISALYLTILSIV